MVWMRREVMKTDPTLEMYNLTVVKESMEVIGKTQFLFQGDMMKTPLIDGYPLKSMNLPRRNDQSVDSGLYTHLYTQREADTMTLVFIYSKNWNDETYMRSMAERYQQCLRGLMTAPKIGEIQCAVPKEELF